jgi:ElaA protein
MKITYKTKHFSKLSVNELYELLKLRVNIFVVEQNCPYPECDDKDKDAYHVMGYNENFELVAYARILAPGVSYESASIGRVVVREDHRKHKLGYQLMERTIADTFSTYKTEKITISAQYHLEKFYGTLGFKSVGDVYPEDDIPHIKMILHS